MKIAIDCGHTLRGADTGAQGCGLREENLTREVGMKVQGKLQALGHNTLIVSCDDASTLGESLSYRTEKANSWGADLYISIHFNATPGGYGTEVYTYQGRELTEARNVLNNICNLGYRNRGIKGNSLYVTNHTSMPSMLVECCFIDSQEDMDRFNSEKMANAIVLGLTGQIADAISPAPVPPHEEPKPQNQVNEVSQLQELINIQGFGPVGVDGIAGPQTLNACPMVRQGANGDITTWIQLRVGANPDGDFGPATKQAVQWFQQSRGLGADGVVGQNTWRALLGL